MKKNQDWIAEFIELIGRQTPVHFYALAQILKVETNDPLIKGKSKPFDIIFKDIMTKINTLNRKQRRDLAKVLKDSALTKDELEERRNRLAKSKEETPDADTLNNEDLREVQEELLDNEIPTV